MKLFITILLITFNLTTAQQINFHYYNLDFEIGAPPTVPFNWELTKQSADFEYNTLSTEDEKYSGKRALTIFNFGEYKEGMYGKIYQKFDAFRYRGKTLKFSAYFKTDFPNDTSKLTLMLSQQNEKNKTDDAKIMEKPVTEKTDWNKYSIEMKVSEDAYTVSIGFVMQGLGACYVDKANLEIIEEYNYEMTNPQELTNQQKSNISSFAKIYSYAKNYIPSSEFQTIDKFNFLRYGVNKVINSSNLTKDLKGIFKTVVPALSISSENNFNNVIYNNDKVDRITLTYKHRIAFNPGTPKLSYTEIKNLYVPDKEREGVMMKNISIGNLAGKELVFSAMAKANLKNIYSNAQLWLRVMRDKKDDINVYMFDNPITSNKWNKYEVRQVIPEDVYKIYIGCVLIGDGDAWFDDIKVSVNENGKLIELEKGLDNFENQNQFDTPMGWNIPKSVKYAGYDVLIDKSDYKKGSKSAKITTEGTHIFSYPGLNETFTKQISDDLNINFPKVLYVDNQGTLPSSQEEEFNQLISELKNHNLNENDFYSQISVIIEYYSYLYHFYKLEDKKNEIDNNLIQSISNLKNKILKVVLREMANNLKDSQIKTWKINDENARSLPFMFEKFGEEFIITKNYGYDKISSIGDKILKINGIDVNTYVDNLSDNLPGSNDNIKTTRAISHILFGDTTETLTFTFENKEVDLKRNILPSEYLDDEKVDISKPDDDILYINMSMIEDKFFKYLEKEITDYKGLILDARGNTLLSEHFLGFFLDNNVKTNLTKVPYFIEPDEVVYEEIQPFLKRLDTELTRNIVFLTDDKTIGYTEFVMHLVKYYGIGTIIGRESAGSPSDVVSIPLPLDYNFSMSAFDVYNPVGNKLTFNRVIPDIKVENKFDAENDLILSEAVKYLKTKITE